MPISTLANEDAPSYQPNFFLQPTSSTHLISKLIASNFITEEIALELFQTEFDKLISTQSLILENFISVEDVLELTIEECQQFNKESVIILTRALKLTWAQVNKSLEELEKLVTTEVLILDGFLTVEMALKLTNSQAAILGEEHITALIEERHIEIIQAKKLSLADSERLLYVSSLILENFISLAEVLKLPRTTCCLLGNERITTLIQEEWITIEEAIHLTREQVNAILLDDEESVLFQLNQQRSLAV